MQTLLLIAEIAGAITGIFALLVLIIKPLRERVLGLEDLKEGMRCQLREQMLRTFYKHREEHTIRQYEYENFQASYKAYKVLKGNSFVDHVQKEIEEWEIVR